MITRAVEMCSASVTLSGQRAKLKFTGFRLWYWNCGRRRLLSGHVPGAVRAPLPRASWFGCKIWTGMQLDSALQCLRFPTTWKLDYNRLLCGPKYCSIRCDGRLHSCVVSKLKWIMTASSHILTSLVTRCSLLNHEASRLLSCPRNAGYHLSDPLISSLLMRDGSSDWACDTEKIDM